MTPSDVFWGVLTVIAIAASLVILVTAIEGISESEQIRRACVAAGYSGHITYERVDFCIGFDHNGELEIELYEDVAQRLEEKGQ